MGDLQQTVAFRLVADATRDVEPRRTRRDDGVTALEKRFGRDGRGLARLGVARDLHDQLGPRGDAPGLPQIALGAVAQRQGQTALPLHRTVGHGPVDGARLRPAILGIDQDILKPSVDHQRRRLAALHLIQKNDAPLHDVPQTGHPAAASRLAVSASGRPTIAEWLPDIHGMKAPAGPWIE